MQTALQLYREPPLAGRRLERIPVKIDATVEHAARGPIDAIVHNISQAGCLAETPIRLDAGAIVSIALSGIGERTARIVWADGRLYGCAFLPARPGEQADAARIGSPVRLVEYRRREGGYIGSYRAETWAHRKPALVAGAISLAAASLAVALLGMTTLYYL